MIVNGDKQDRTSNLYKCSLTAKVRPHLQHTLNGVLHIHIYGDAK